jgi:RHS repeat-associated protein
MKSFLKLAWVTLLASICVPCGAQGYLYATGSPSFSTQIPVQNGFIDVNNGNLHLEFPLVTHPQRGSLQLNERLVYDSRIWKIVQSSGKSWQPTNVPSSAGGWRFTTGLETGTVSNYEQDFSQDTDDTCRTGRTGREIPDITITWSTYSQFQWTDPQGTSHMFPVETSQPTQVCYGDGEYTQATGAGYALDSSGYYLVVSGYTNMTVYDPSGNEVYPQIKDRNGNYFSADGSGNLIDTQGNTPVLVSSSGSQTFYDVLATGGGRQRYTVNMGTVSFATSYGQTGVAEASGTLSVITSIGLPDGSSYTFNYDSGTYGELTSITLPSGSTETFGYSNISDVYSNQNRWVTSRVRDGGTTTISPTIESYCSGTSSCQVDVDVTSPSGNDSLYVIGIDSGDTANNSSETQYDYVFQGSESSGNQIVNGSTTYTWQQVTSSDGTYVYQSPTQIAQTYQYLEYPSGSHRSLTVTSLVNGYLPGTVGVWDYNNTSTTATETTATTYGYSANGALFPTQTTVTDSSGSQVSQVTYTYDGSSLTTTTGLPNHSSVSGGRGNLTNTSQWLNSPSGTVQTSMTYDDAGTVLTATTPLGTTSYAHDPNDTFVTTTTPPTPPSGVSLATAQSYDASSGVLLSSTDANGASTSYQSFDVFDRPQQITYPDGGIENIAYSPTQITDTKDFDSHTIRSQTVAYLDGYGRTKYAVTYAGSAVYRTDTCYNSDGRTQFTSLPYPYVSGSNNCSGTGNTYTYDGLGRVTEIAKPDGTTIAKSYNGIAVKTIDENGVTRIAQNSIFGQPSIVCEISSTTTLPGGDSPVSCGTDISGTGFVTSYAYNLAGHQATVTQGVQTRVFQTDSLGRTILTTEPERGQTTYSYAYNSTGLAVTRTRPTANQTGTATTTTVTQSDNQGRPISISYSDGTAGKTYTYDQPTSGGFNFGASKGRLTTAAASGTELGTAYTAQTQIGYDIMGRPNATLQCLPNWCGNSNLNLYRWASYNYGSQLETEQYSTTNAGGNVVTINNTFDTAGRLTGVTGGQNNSTNSPGIVAYSSFSPSGPQQAQFGNGLYSPMQYDVAGRLSGGWVCSGSTVGSCPGGTQLYGFIDQPVGRQVASATDTIINEGMYFSYDEFGRLSGQSYSYGPVNTGLAFTYDRYGNRWTQTPTSGSAPSPSLSFNTAKNQIVSTGYTYDAAGNLLTDGMHSYTYDADGNMMLIDGGSTASFVYDAGNERVKVTSGGVVQRFGFDLSRRRSTTWADGSSLSEVSAKYYAGATGVAYWRAADGNIHFEHQNWVGTERLRTSYNGAAESTFGSLPFGDAFAASSSDTDSEHFGLLDRDATTTSDLGHATFREYDPTSGQWLSPDPYDFSYSWWQPQSLNRYAYVLNDPLTLMDPSGQVCTLSIFGVKNNQGEYDNVTGGPGSGVYPYNNLSTAQAVGSIFGQSYTGPNMSTFSVTSAMNANYMEPGGVNVVAFSGGAQAYSTAVLYTYVGTSTNQITYLSPGIGPGQSLPGSTASNIFKGSGATDFAATFFARADLYHLNPTGCTGHNFLCENQATSSISSNGSRGPCTARAPVVTGSSYGSSSVLSTGQSSVWFIWFDSDMGFVLPSTPIEQVTSTIIFNP